MRLRQVSKPVNASLIACGLLPGFVYALCCDSQQENIDVSKKKQNFSTEMRMFDATKERTPNIMKLFESVQTVPATSVEAERAFSAAGLFITKIRSRLSDANINALSVLRTHYKNK